MITHDDEGYYFDRIHIVSWCSKSALEDQLPREEMAAACKSFIVVELDKQDDQLQQSVKDKSPEEKPYSGYKSRVEVIAPTTEFLRLLSENEAALGRAYKISYVEIAHDVFYNKSGTAELRARNLYCNLRKKYSHAVIYRDKSELTREILAYWKKNGFLAQENFYADFKGNKPSTNFSIYPRISKMNGKHCVHSEWRFSGSGIVRKKTHTKTVQDLHSFDIEIFFKEMEAKYLVKEEINILALGKWLKGYDGRKVLTAKQIMSAELIARHYMLFRIDTYSDLVLHFKSEKESIKKKCGVRSEWAKKLMSLSSYERFRDVQ